MYKKNYSTYYLYKIYKKNDDSLEKLKKAASTLGLSFFAFISHVQEYIRQNIPKTKFSVIFDNLLLIKKKEDVLAYLDSWKKEGITIGLLEGEISNYIREYRADNWLYKDDRIFIDLRKKLRFYTSQPKQKGYLKTNIDLDPNYLHHITDTMNRFLFSKFSLERFLVQEKSTLSFFRQYTNDIKKYMPSLYEVYLTTLKAKEEQKEKELEKDVYKLLSKIKEAKEEFDSIDFFSNTLFGVKELMKASDQVLNEEDRKLFRKNIGKFLTIQSFSPGEINVLFNDTFIFNIDGIQTEITPDDKTRAIYFLQEGEIPICNETFRDAINRFYQKKLSTSKHR